jgi:hypothetical protein
LVALVLLAGPAVAVAPLETVGVLFAGIGVDTLLLLVVADTAVALDVALAADGIFAGTTAVITGEVLPAVAILGTGLGIGALTGASIADAAVARLVLAGIRLAGLLVDVVVGIGIGTDGVAETIAAVLTRVGIDTGALLAGGTASTVVVGLTGPVSRLARSTLALETGETRVRRTGVGTPAATRTGVGAFAALGIADAVLATDARTLAGASRTIGATTSRPERDEETHEAEPEPREAGNAARLEPASASRTYRIRRHHLVLRSYGTM